MAERADAVPATGVRGSDFMLIVLAVIVGVAWWWKNGRMTGVSRARSIGSVDTIVGLWNRPFFSISSQIACFNGMADTVWYSSCSSVIDWLIQQDNSKRRRMKEMKVERLLVGPLLADWRGMSMMMNQPTKRTQRGFLFSRKESTAGKHVRPPAFKPRLTRKMLRMANPSLFRGISVRAFRA